MHIFVRRPIALSPEELDDYLARGWYRIGQTLMTCRFLVARGALRSTIWTRLPLESYRFRKGLRKLMSRNARRFDVRIGRAAIDLERERVYSAYLEIAHGDRARTLRELLYGDSDRDLFDTLEMQIRDGDRLVAFSWFDPGGEGVQSVAGIYDPAYARHSLGFYTMLLEIQWGMRAAKRYHYSGYVLPGDPSMDYKLRVGDGLEFWDPERELWLPWADMAHYELPTQRLEASRQRARDSLAERGIIAPIRLNRMFGVGAYQPELRICLDQPLYLECARRRTGDRALVLTWDLDLGVYIPLVCHRAVAHAGPREGPPSETVELLVVRRRMGATPDPERAAEIVRRLLRRR